MFTEGRNALPCLRWTMLGIGQEQAEILESYSTQAEQNELSQQHVAERNVFEVQPPAIDFLWDCQGLAANFAS